MKRHLQNWAAAYILLVMFIGSWLGQFFSQVITERNDAATHHESFAWADFWPQFISSTLENWQSEFLQLAFQALLVASFYQRYIFRADFSADKDDVAELNRKLDQLIER